LCITNPAKEPHTACLVRIRITAENTTTEKRKKKRKKKRRKKEEKKPEKNKDKSVDCCTKLLLM
jgi:hypothetical protein